MPARATNNVKDELAKKAETATGEAKLKKSMSIADLIKAMMPEITPGIERGKVTRANTVNLFPPRSDAASR